MKKFQKVSKKRKRADEKNFPLTIHDIIGIHTQFWSFNTSNQFDNVVSKTRAISFYGLDETILSSIRKDQKRRPSYCFDEIIRVVFKKFGSAEKFIADHKIRNDKQIAAEIAQQNQKIRNSMKRLVNLVKEQAIMGKLKTKNSELNEIVRQQPEKRAKLISILNQRLVALADQITQHEGIEVQLFLSSQIVN